MNRMKDTSSRKNRAVLHSQALAIRLRFQRCFECRVKDMLLTLELPEQCKAFFQILTCLVHVLPLTFTL